MKMNYYLYGAGNNSWGVIKYFGKENFIKIIDSDKDKFGQSICGIDIIDIESFLREYKGQPVIISVFAKSTDILEVLEEYGIHNYYLAPIIQYGYVSCSEWIEDTGVQDKRSIAIYGTNPLSRLLLQKLEQLDCKANISYIIETDSKFKDMFKDCNLPIKRKDFGKVDTIFLTEDVSEPEKKMLNRIANRGLSAMNSLIEKKCIKKFHQLNKYKNLHKGKRCFLIGNGPSLKIADLERLSLGNEVTFGCNGISLLYDKTEWRPTYYFIAEYNVYRSYYDALKENTKSVKFIREYFELDGYQYPDDINVYKAILEREFSSHPRFSDNMVTGLFGARTVMYDMIQAAAFMGFQEIYLLGVDFSWGELSSPSHFIKDYSSENVVKNGFRYKAQNILTYEKAEMVSRNYGFRIYNATRGGNLEIFERVDFDGLFQ